MRAGKPDHRPSCKPYDRSMKSILAGAEPGLARLLLGPGVTTARPLPTETSRVEMRHRDVLLDVVWNGQPVLVHVEFQVSHGRHMLSRMLRYYADVISSRGTRIPVYQVALCLGSTVPTSATYLCHRFADDSYLDYRYRVVALGGLSWNDIIGTGCPRLWALLPLVERQRRRADPEAYLRACVEKIASSPLPPEEKCDTALAASVLAGLVVQRDRVDRIFKEVLAMFDITKSSTYQLLTEKAHEEGR
ncbi:MAG: hypothetical protein IMW99_10565, partial [Firmicutes bacterium]|nr:hypothetical protein [Bacillota bacterium]